MKVQIENTLSGRTSLSIIEFNELLSQCLNSDSENELRIRFEDDYYKANECEYFDYGFGGNHFWVSEKVSNKRILFVEFN
ncbi:hypothetical protein MEO93_20865 [Dolichospermum sp. ST_sed3]|nr:hypothetical protein [Dolichospermum sp. ST_sed3]